MISSVRPYELDMPCYGPFAARSVRLFITTRVQELAVHGWDMQASLEPSTHLSPATVPLVLERMTQWLTNRSLSDFRLPSSQSSGVRLRVDTGVAANHDIIVTRDSCVLESAGDSSKDADVVLRCDGELGALLAYERVSVDSVFGDGSIQGDVTLGNELLSWLKGK